MIAANSVSSGVSCVPPPCGRTFDGGISGFAISHSPSGTIQLHVPRPMNETTTPHHVGHGLSTVRIRVTPLLDQCVVRSPVKSPVDRLRAHGGVVLGVAPLHIEAEPRVRGHSQIRRRWKSGGCQRRATDRFTLQALGIRRIAGTLQNFAARETDPRAGLLRRPQLLDLGPPFLQRHPPLRFQRLRRTRRRALFHPRGTVGSNHRACLKQAATEQHQQSHKADEHPAHHRVKTHQSELPHRRAQPYPHLLHLAHRNHKVARSN
jgi:hypothetical protein